MLRDGEVNDTAIDFIAMYHAVNGTADARVRIYNSLLWTSITSRREWTARHNIFDTDFLLVPMNRNNHWTLALVCYPNNCYADAAQVGARRTRVLVFDSLRGKSRAKARATADYVGKAVGAYLAREHRTQFLAAGGNHRNHPRRAVEPIPTVAVRCPQQTNAVDCGMFVVQLIGSYAPAHARARASHRVCVCVCVALLRVDVRRQRSCVGPGTRRGRVSSCAPMNASICRFCSVRSRCAPFATAAPPSTNSFPVRRIPCPLLPTAIAVPRRVHRSVRLPLCAVCRPVAAPEQVEVDGL